MTKKQTILRSTLGALFIGAGVIQATHRELFMALVPRQFSKHAKQLQGTATGALVGLGVSFFIPRLRHVGPLVGDHHAGRHVAAAIDQVRKPEQTSALGLPPVAVALRIPMQAGVLIAAWIATQKTTNR
jgi:uncharacterized membrane protein